MSMSTPGLVSKWLLIAKCRPSPVPMDTSRSWSNTRPRPGCVYAMMHTFFSPATPSSSFVHFFVLSLLYDVVWTEPFWVICGRITRGVECAVHQTAWPSLSLTDEITGAKHVAHTLIFCRLGSSCLSTRLCRWLTVTSVESGARLRLGVCCVSVRKECWMHLWNGQWFTQWQPPPPSAYTLWTHLWLN